MKLKTIRIGDKEYPLLCDLNVLEALQDEFGTVNAFERELLGLYYVKDKDGNQIYREDGGPSLKLTEPSIRAIRAALPLMVNEGLAYRAFEENRPCDPLADMEILAGCRIPYTDLAEILHDVYKDCFSVKKSMPGKGKAEKKPQ